MSSHRHRPGLRRRAAVAGLALLVSAGPGLGACGGGAGIQETASDTVERALSVPAGTPVRVETFNGAIDVTPGAGPGVSAEVERIGAGGTESEAESDRDEIEVTLELADGTAVLRATYTPSPDSITGRSAIVTLRVPEATPLELRTSNGSVSVKDVAGPVAVRTSNGRVELAGATGIVTVETSNGAILVDATSATADLRTSNARLSFSGSLGPGEHSFTTSNGLLELRLPADAAFTLDAGTSNGTVDSAFAIIGEVTDDTLRGTAGDAAAAGAITIEARTSNQDIEIIGR